VHRSRSSLTRQLPSARSNALEGAPLSLFSGDCSVASKEEKKRITSYCFDEEDARCDRGIGIRGGRRVEEWREVEGRLRREKEGKKRLLDFCDDSRTTATTKVNDGNNDERRTE
jgi:hypothetical protein